MCYKYQCSLWGSSHNCSQQWLKETVRGHICDLRRFKEQRTVMAKNKFPKDDVWLMAASAAYSESTAYLSSHLQQGVKTHAYYIDAQPLYQLTFDFITFPNIQIFYILCNQIHRYFFSFLPLFLCLKYFSIQFTSRFLF